MLFINRLIAYVVNLFKTPETPETPVDWWDESYSKGRVHVPQSVLAYLSNSWGRTHEVWQAEPVEVSLSHTFYHSCTGNREEYEVLLETGRYNGLVQRERRCYTPEELMELAKNAGWNEGWHNMYNKARRESGWSGSKNGY